MPPFEIVAPRSVFRALDDLGNDDYDLVAAAILALAEAPTPGHAKKLRMPNARFRLADGTEVSGPFLSVRCRSATGGQRGGFRIIYVLDARRRRVCVAKVARRDDETYRDLERVLKGAILGVVLPPPVESDP